MIHHIWKMCKLALRVVETRNARRINKPNDILGPLVDCQNCTASRQGIRRILASFVWLLLIHIFLLHSPVSAGADDCAQHGGNAECTAPTPGNWDYMLCDDAPAFTSRVYTWCVVQGGTWNGSGCSNASPVKETTVYPFSESFERTLYNVQNCQFNGQDGGWLLPGQSISSWNCWSGSPKTQNGIEVFNLREMPFSGQTFSTSTQSCSGSMNERVLALRTRGIGCPTKYRMVTIEVSPGVSATFCRLDPPVPEVEKNLGCPSRSSDQHSVARGNPINRECPEFCV